MTTTTEAAAPVEDTAPEVEAELPRDVIHLPAPQGEPARLLMSRRHVLADLAESQSLSARQFIIGALAAANVPAIQQCTPVTVAIAVFNAAAMSLRFGDAMGECYLVPFKNTKGNRIDCSLIVGYQGFCKMAFRSRWLKTHTEEVILKGEDPRITIGDGVRRIEHDITDRILRGETPNFDQVVAAYSSYTTNDGGVGVVIVPKADLQKIKSRSKNDPWKFSPIPMSKKSAIRQASKEWNLHGAEQLSQAIYLDEQAERHATQLDLTGNFSDKPAEAEFVIDGPEPTEQRTVADDLALAVERARDVDELANLPNRIVEAAELEEITAPQKDALLQLVKSEISRRQKSSKAKKK